MTNLQSTFVIVVLSKIVNIALGLEEMIPHGISWNCMGTWPEYHVTVVDVPIESHTSEVSVVVVQGLLVITIHITLTNRRDSGLRSLGLDMHS